MRKILPLLLLLASLPIYAKPKMTVTLVAEGTVPNPGSSLVTINAFFILSDGTRVIGHCSTSGPEICIIEPFAAEKRKKTECFFESLGIQAMCYGAEAYPADRKVNKLTVYGAMGGATFHIDGTWDNLKPGLMPSRPKWTAICNDDTISYSENRSGTCSEHNGVKIWRVP